MNLVPLFEEALEFQDYNGTVLSNGKAAVYYIGRTRLADIYNDVAAEYPAENPRILDNLGMGPVYVNPAFDYELVVFDAYDNELFSVKKYIHSKGEHSTANVVVTPSENIAVSAWTVGDVQVYMPYLTGQLGKVYEGIEPIVVNNTEDKISANHVPLGVQDPLYFVQDDEEGCIIGFSGQTIPEGVMSESALGFENNKITGYNGSAFSAGNEYEAGSYVDITDNTISVTGLPNSADVQNIVDVATSGLMPSGDYLTKESADTLYAPTGNYLTGLPEDLVYTADITGLATTADLDNKLDKTDSANFLLTSDSAKFYPMDSNPSGYLTGLPSDLATTGWVDSQGYLTAVDIPESAVWNATTQTVSANSAQWAGGTANPQIPVTGINGIKISESGDKVVFEVSADYYPGNNPSGFITGVDLTPYQEKADMTAYATVESLTAKQDAGDYLSATDSANFLLTSDSGNFLTAIPGTYLQNTDLTISDNKVTEISGIPLAAGGDVPAGTMNESAFGYDASDNITAYNGSAFKAGDEFPQSATEAVEYVTATSANIDSTIDNVSANSGTWGGSALPISAGPGVDLSVSDDKLVISAVPSAFYTVGISDIILTASLPVSPDANTLYLIQE